MYNTDAILIIYVSKVALSNSSIMNVVIGSCILLTQEISHLKLRIQFALKCYSTGFMGSTLSYLTTL